MRRAIGATIRTGVALVIAVAGAAVARAQPPTVSIEDVWVVEGNANWLKQIRVTLSAASASPIDVGWHTVGGSATADVDFVSAATPSSPMVHFDPGFTEATLSVEIKGDGIDEWNPAHMDEAFFIDLEPPPPLIATLLKSRGTVTIVDDDAPYPPLQFVSAVADGPGGVGRVRLQWRVPPAPPLSAAPDDVLVRWNVGSNCPAPATTGVAADGQFSLFARGIGMNAPSYTQMVEDSPLSFLPRCYSLFAMYSGTPSQPAFVTATPFLSDPPNPVAWAYSVGTYSPGGGAPAVVPPTVGTYAVYTIDNDGVVHAMTRGVNGGTWLQGPTPEESWHPVGLRKPASNRSPVVGLREGQRLFVGTDSGEVHAVNGEDGAIVWSRSAPFGSALPNTSGAGQGTPAGIFTTWGAPVDAILVGTDKGTSNNFFYMLDPATGNPAPVAVNAFTDASMGGVLGMAAVNYPSQVSDPGQVFFVTNSAVGTLWGLSIGVAGFGLLPGGYPVGLAGGATGSPVIRNGHVYFGTGTAPNFYVRAYDVTNTGSYSFLDLTSLVDGGVKSFVFPDRRNGNFYFSTNSWVLQARDTTSGAPSLSLQYQWPVPGASIVLYRPSTDFVYVGSSNGQLYQINTVTRATKSVPLEPSGKQIFAPTLDGPNNLVLVGSVSGVVYAVRADSTTGIP